MPIEELQPGDWNRAAENIDRSLKDALVTVQVVDKSGELRDVIDSAPLNSFTFDRSDPCNDRISVCAGDPPMTYVIVDPMRIKVRHTDDGEFNPLEIQSENGIVFLRFNPSLRAALTEFLRAA